jgi:hypothetical protein
MHVVYHNDVVYNVCSKVRDVAIVAMECTFIYYREENVTRILHKDIAILEKKE